MPNKMILVDIDGCLLQQGQLNTALVAKLKRLQQKGYSIYLFTQLNAGVLIEKINRALSIDPEARLNESIRTIAQVLAALKNQGLDPVQVSTSTDLFDGEPCRYYDNTIHAFEEALEQAYTVAAEKGGKAAGFSVDINHQLTGGQSLQQILEAENQSIKTYLELMGEDELLEQEKHAYLVSAIKTHINTITNKQQKQQTLAQFDQKNYTKTELLQIADSIFHHGLALSGDFLSTSDQPRTYRDENIYHPINKNHQLAHLVRCNKKPEEPLTILLFDDSPDNLQEMQSFLEGQQDPLLKFTSYLVSGEKICHYQQPETQLVPVAEITRYVLTEDQRREYIAKLEQALDDEDEVTKEEAENALQELGIELNFQSTRAAKLLHAIKQSKNCYEQLARKQQELNGYDKASTGAIALQWELQRLKLASLFLEQHISSLTHIQTDYIENQDTLWYDGPVADHQLFNQPTYILTDERLYFIPNAFNQAKTLDRITHHIPLPESQAESILQRLRALGKHLQPIDAQMQKEIFQLIGHRSIAVHHLNTQTSTEELTFLAMGCSGKEPNILQKVADPLRTWNAQEKVARGMDQYLYTAADEEAVIPILLGDQAYHLPVNVEADVLQAYPYLVNARGIAGNHELGCEGNGLSLDQALENRQAYQQGLIEAQDGQQPRLWMPAPYYVETIKNKRADQYQAFLIYIDSSLLPVDTDQQQWLQGIVKEIEAADPHKMVPRFLVAHHSLSESADKRGVKGREGKKYANPTATTGNQHQLLAATLQALKINVSDYLVLASHMHGTNFSVRGAWQDAQHAPLAQLVLGDGGSYSNKDNTHSFTRGSVYMSDAGFGFGVIHLSPSKPIQIEYHDCDAVDPSVDPDVSQDLSVPYRFQINYATKTTQVDEVAFPKVLLKRQAQTLAVLVEVTNQGALSVLSFHLLVNYGADLQNLQRELASYTVDTSCFQALVHFTDQPGKTIADKLNDFQHILERCLRLLIDPIAFNHGQAVFAQKPKQLFIALQSYQSFLGQWQHALAKGFSHTMVVEALRGIYIKPRTKLLSRESTFLHQHRQALESDDEQDELEDIISHTSSPDKGIDVSNPLQASAVVAAVSLDNSPEWQALKHWRRNRRPLSPDVQHTMTRWLQHQWQNPILWRFAIQRACGECLQKQPGFGSKAVFEKQLLPFHLGKDNDLGFYYWLDYVAKTAPDASLESVFASLVKGISRDHWPKDFQALLVKYAVIELAQALNTAAPNDHNFRYFIQQLQNEPYEGYDGHTEEDIRGRQHWALYGIVVDCLAPKTVKPHPYQGCLSKAAAQAMVSDTFWQQQIYHKISPALDPQAMQWCYEVQQEQKQQSVASGWGGWFGAKEAVETGPLFQLAQAVVSQPDEEHFYHKLSPTLQQHVVAQRLKDDPGLFAAYKTALTEARTAGVLKKLPEPVAFVPLNERKVLVPPLDESAPWQSFPSEGRDSSMASTQQLPTTVGNPLHTKVPRESNDVNSLNC